MATYSNLSGSGVQALSANVSRLYIDVGTFGKVLSTGRANPTNYFHLGLVRLGVGARYFPPHPVDAAAMVLDCPPGVTSLGYSLQDTTTITVTEIIGSLTQPITNATRVRMSVFQSLAANAPDTTLLTYTPAAGRQARLQPVAGMISGAATDTSRLRFSLAGTNFWLVYPNNTQQASQIVAVQLATPLDVFAGETLLASANNATAAPITAAASFLGIEFDATAWSP